MNLLKNINVESGVSPRKQTDHKKSHVKWPLKLLYTSKLEQSYAEEKNIFPKSNFHVKKWCFTLPQHHLDPVLAFSISHIGIFILHQVITQLLQYKQMKKNNNEHVSVNHNFLCFIRFKMEKKKKGKKKLPPARTVQSTKLKIKVWQQPV